MSSIENIFILIIVGFIAGIINVIAGGGSFLTLPILIFLGLPPTIANGTNRIALVFQNVVTTVSFKSKGISNFPFSISLGISALFGAIIGSQIAIDISGELFNKILSIIMLLMVLYLVFKPKTGTHILKERTKGKYFWISIIAFFFIGIYGGFIQAGVGFIILLVLNGFNRIPLVKSNAIKLVIVLIYMSVSILIFAYHDKINWLYGIGLGIGNATGGWVGSRWSIKKGDGLVKKILIIMVIVMAIKLWFF